MKYDYKWRITSKSAQVPPLVRDMLDILHDKYNGLTVEEHGDIKLILNELIFNAVIHGNKSDEGKYVYIYLTAEESSISVCVSDEGTGFDTSGVRFRPGGGDWLNMENGRGIALARALSDKMTYSNEGRTVTFTKNIGLIAPVLNGV